jgi:hypothetical protein
VRSLIRRALELRKRYETSVVAVGLILLVVVVFTLDQANDQDRFEGQARITRHLRISEIDRQYAACLDTREFRETFAGFLDQTAQPSGQGVDYSRLATFAALDPATKAFLDELGAVQSAGRPRMQIIADRYRERFFPLPDCERIQAEALEELPE